MKIEFWGKPTPYIDKMWHAFLREDGRNCFTSVCGDILVAERIVSRRRKTMPKTKCCAKCISVG